MVDIRDLEAMIANRDRGRLADTLAGLDRDDTSAGATWYRRTGRKQARQMVDPYDNDSWTIQLMMAVALAETPEVAVAACRWNTTDNVAGAGGDRLLAVMELAARRGREWCAEFVETASHVKVARSWDAPTREIAALSSALVAFHDFSVPTGPQYAWGWAEVAFTTQLKDDRAVKHDLVRLARINHDGHAGYAPSAVSDGGLSGFFDATPRLHDTLVRVTETPEALAALGRLDHDGWAVPDAIRAAAASGAIRREELLEAVLQALTRNYRPSEQKIITQFLTGLDFGPNDLSTRSAFIAQVLPTVHGMVTEPLLSAFLNGPVDPDDLLDIGSTILLRKEKKQKVRLLTYLEVIPAGSELVEAAHVLLEQAAALDDRVLVERAQAALDKLGHRDRTPVSAIDVVVPWDPDPVPYAPGPFRRAEPDEVGLAKLVGDIDAPGVWLHLARWLDAAVRFGARDLDALRVALQNLPKPMYLGSHPYEPLVRWARGQSPEDVPDTDPLWADRTLTGLLTNETTARLGTVRELLSTPSRADGSLAFDDLAARLHAAGDAGYGPYDLLQALLRLEPTSPHRLAVLDKTHVWPPGQEPPKRRFFQRKPAEDLDAVPVVRAWVEGGGLPGRQTDVAGGRIAVAPVTLPAVPPQLTGHPLVAALCSGVDPDPRSDVVNTGSAGQDYLAVIPYWSEVVAARLEVYRERRRWLNEAAAAQASWMVVFPGPLGPAFHLVLARALTDADRDRRMTAAAVMVTALTESRLDPDLFEQGLERLLDRDELSLVRSADAWEQVILGGGLSFLWDPIGTVLDRAIARKPVPAGLAEVLRMLRPYARVAAAADADLPMSAYDLAGGPGATKAKAEARALVDAIRAELQ